MTESLRVRLDSSHPADAGWACPPSRPQLILRCDGADRVCRLFDASENVLREWLDPLGALDWMEAHANDPSRPVGGRWIGYLSYELGRLLEHLPARADDDLHLPLFVFGWVEVTGDVPLPIDKATVDREVERQLSSTFSRDEYLRAVSRCIDYIRAGDVFQINLSQRFTAASKEPPPAIYDRLLASAPAWYGALLEFDDHALICNSPELFVRVRPHPGGRRITTRPIKGTRPRQAGMDQQLLASEKDRAELNMIVDLERNDLGRVCRTGTVKVTESRTIEAHPTVYHGAATVEGTLREGVSFVGLLRAMFPGGSITGAPKIRAMEIIDELEPARRGPYCGAIGYLAADGRIEFNVAIRTMIVKDSRVYVSVGGGIVADSEPAEEYAETLVKAKAMFAALGIELPGAADAL